MSSCTHHPVRTAMAGQKRLYDFDCDVCDDVSSSSSSFQEPAGVFSMMQCCETGAADGETYQTFLNLLVKIPDWELLCQDVAGDTVMHAACRNINMRARTRYIFALLGRRTCRATLVSTANRANMLPLHYYFAVWDAGDVTEDCLAVVQAMVDAMDQPRLTLATVQRAESPWHPWNTFSYPGDTVLHAACGSNTHRAVVDMLLENMDDATVALRNQHGRTALHCFCERLCIAQPPPFLDVLPSLLQRTRQSVQKNTTDASILAYNKNLADALQRFYDTVPPSVLREKRWAKRLERLLQRSQRCGL